MIVNGSIPQPSVSGAARSALCFVGAVWCTSLMTASMSNVDDLRYSVDVRLWGKSQGLGERTYPLICHLIDALAVAESVWDQYLSSGQRAVIAEGLGVSAGDARQVIGLWAGLHDLGKAIPDFQRMDRSAFAALAEDPSYGTNPATPGTVRHDQATHLALREVLADLGYPIGDRPKKSVAHRVAQMLGGHHGRYHPMLSGRDWRDPGCREPRLGGGRWRRQRLLMGRVVHEVAGRPAAPERVTPDAAVLVTGAVIVADWLASQESFIKARLSDLSGSWEELLAHADRSRADAPALVEAAGLRRAKLRDAEFEAAFGYLPNSLQRSIVDGLPSLVRGPGLLMVTAPTGDGKTEAALYAARLMGAAAGASGIFLALPTMATADQMYGRLREFAAANLRRHAGLTLVHSMAWLNTAYADGDLDRDARPATQGAAGDDERVLTEDDLGAAARRSPRNDSRVDAEEWLKAAKRGLLAPLSVATVDQVLLAVLTTRHNALRMLGLAGKVLIIDEAHAYTPYMHALLRMALVWLGALRVPVVLLSATLTSEVAAGLVRSYLHGAGHPALPAGVGTSSYPGWAYADAATGAVTGREVGTDRPRHLRVELRDVTHHYDDGTDARGRVAALRDVLAPLTAEGGCAAVVCTTVAEAQRTYLALRDWFASLVDPPELHLLHARFPARQREELTRRIVARMGKNAGDDRPSAAVLVATQVIEQSLDLDFDMVISDLAPLAMLLQRAGRCHRHDRRRPLWLAGDPRLTVLVPISDDGKLNVPLQWGEVYDKSLLRRTLELLRRQGHVPVRLPEDVQKLVDGVYADEFAATDPEQLNQEDLERLGREQAEESYADVVAVPLPKDADNLHRLSEKEFDEATATTRLGADSVRVVCCYVDDTGRRWLDTECTRPLPERGSGDGRRFTRDDVRAVLGESIPVRATWLAGRGTETDPPESWRDSPWLRDVVLLSHRLSDGENAEVAVGHRTFRLDAQLGLTSTI